MSERMLKKILSATIIVNIIFPFGIVFAEEPTQTTPAATVQEMQSQDTTGQNQPAETQPDPSATNSAPPTGEQPKDITPEVNNEGSTSDAIPDKNCGTVPEEMISTGKNPENNSISEIPPITPVTEVEKKENHDSGNKDDVRKDNEIKNNNIADVINDIWSGANTGYNDVSHNDRNASIDTGNANTVLDLINFINSNFITTDGGEIVYLFKNIYSSLFGDYIIDPLNGDVYDLNGKKINLQDSDLANKLNIENNNEAGLLNDINLYSNSGFNEAKYNDGNAQIQTGDANTALNLFNMLNTNFIVSEKGLFGAINIFGDFLGDLLLPSWLTSAFVNDGGAAEESENKIDIENNNNALITNNIFGGVNTGGNDAKNNDGTVALATGDANALLNIKNIANTNVVGDVVYFILVNVTGKWSGESIIPVEYLANGSDGVSFLISNLNLKNFVDIVNNNDATITNNIGLWANTGWNSASHNDGNASIITGDANVIGNIINIANSNIIGKKVVFLTVNIFGDWIGNIDEFDKEQVQASNNASEGSPIIQLTNFTKPLKKKTKNSLSHLGSNKLGRNWEEGISAVASISSDFPTQKEIEEAEEVLGRVKDFNPDRFNDTLIAKARPYLVVLLVVYLGFLSAYLRRGNIKK